MLQLQHTRRFVAFSRKSESKDGCISACGAQTPRQRKHQSALFLHVRDAFPIPGSPGWTRRAPLSHVQRGGASRSIKKGSTSDGAKLQWYCFCFTIPRALAISGRLGGGGHAMERWKGPANKGDKHRGPSPGAGVPGGEKSLVERRKQWDSRFWARRQGVVSGERPGCAPQLGPVAVVGDADAQAVAPRQRQ